MAFEYYDIEDAIVAVLQVYSSLFEAIPLPDNEAAFKRGIVKPRVTVGFAGGKNLGLTATDVVRYEEELTVICNIQSRTLRGEIGCHHICKAIKSVVNGLKIQGRQLAYQDYQPSDPLRDETNNLWGWDLSFTLRKMQVQELIPPSETIGTYQDITGITTYENAQPTS